MYNFDQVLSRNFAKKRNYYSFFIKIFTLLELVHFFMKMQQTIKMLVAIYSKNKSTRFWKIFNNSLDHLSLLGMVY